MALPTSTREARPATRRRFAFGLGPVVLMVFLLLVGCGSTAGVASLPGSAGSGGTGGSSTDGSGTGGGDTAGGSATGDTTGGDTPGGSGSGGTSDLHPTRALNMQIRVVNLWIPTGAQQGGAIDVWVGSPQFGGKKLKTVEYGTVSEFFPPETDAPLGSGPADGHEDYRLTFYPVGKTGDDDELITQNGTSSPGAKVTYLTMPADPDGRGLTLQSFLDDPGSEPTPAGSLDDPVLQIPAGKAVLSLTAAPMQYRGADPKNGPSYVAASVGGQCLQYLDRETGKVHEDPNVVETLGGTYSLAYVVDPGAKVRVNQFPDDQTSAADTCAGKPTLDGIDPGIAAGQRAYGFVYGIDEQQVKILVVPVG